MLPILVVSREPRAAPFRTASVRQHLMMIANFQARHLFAICYWLLAILAQLVPAVGSIWPVGAVRLVWTISISKGGSVGIGQLTMRWLGCDFLLAVRPFLATANFLAPHFCIP